MEKFSTARHSLGLLRPVAFTARYEAPNSSLSSEEVLPLLYAALHTVVAKHPALNCGIVNEHLPDPAYVRLENIDLRHCVVVKQDTKSGSLWHEKTLEDILSHEHSLLWQHLSTRPPWKLLVIPHFYGSNTSIRPVFDMSFVFHHALIDGLSGPAFHSSLLEALNRPSEPTCTSPIIKVAQSINLPPPIEDRLNLNVTYRHLLSELLDTYLPTWMRRLCLSSGLPWTGSLATLPTDSPYLSNVRVIEIPADRLNDILTYSRQARSSFTAILHGIIVLHLLQLIPDAQAFVASTPYSVRSFVGTSPEEIVNQVSVVTTTYSRHLIESEAEKADSAVVHAIGRHVLDDLRESKTAFPVNNALSLLPYVNDFHNFFRNKIGQRRAATFEVSNLGVFRQVLDRKETKIGQDWHVQRVLFTQAGSVVGNALSFNVASVEGGPLTISLTWQDDAVETGQAETLLQQIKESFDQLGTVSRSFSQTPSPLS